MHLILPHKAIEWVWVEPCAWLSCNRLLTICLIGRPHAPSHRWQFTWAPPAWRAELNICPRQREEKQAQQWHKWCISSDLTWPVNFTQFSEIEYSNKLLSPLTHFLKKYIKLDWIIVGNVTNKILFFFTRFVHQDNLYTWTTFMNFEA